jgi:hypothetical protein
MVEKQRGTGNEKRLAALNLYFFKGRKIDVREQLLMVQCSPAVMVLPTHDAANIALVAKKDSQPLEVCIVVYRERFSRRSQSFFVEYVAVPETPQSTLQGFLSGTLDGAAVADDPQVFAVDISNNAWPGVTAAKDVSFFVDVDLTPQDWTERALFGKPSSRGDFWHDLPLLPQALMWRGAARTHGLMGRMATPPLARYTVT